MTNYVVFRIATLDEIERTEANVSPADGAGAVLIDAGLVGITNEYGTAAWTASGIDPIDVEKLAEAASKLMSAPSLEEALAAERNHTAASGGGSE